MFTVNVKDNINIFMILSKNNKTIQKYKKITRFIKHHMNITSEMKYNMTRERWTDLSSFQIISSGNGLQC